MAEQTKPLYEVNESNEVVLRCQGAIVLVGPRYVKICPENRPCLYYEPGAYGGWAYNWWASMVKKAREEGHGER